MLKIYNTLSKNKDEFKPLKAPKVKMYTCGVTVYDDCHIGHARSLYIFEIMRRYLKFRGFEVKFIRNITDVDDKIINKAKAWADEKGISLEEAFELVRNTYIDSYYKDLKGIELPMADAEPKATENIPDMIKFIQGLIKKGIAYEAAGSVYFSVRDFKGYGKLSGKKLDDLMSSVRIESDPAKKDSFDFALWKAAKEGEPSWDSPWGKGRPGWHIECSVMSQKYLKTDTLDIHGGGRDLVFPHHENELSQSEALTGKTFANYWIHHGLLTINAQKMAKSLGNFVTIQEVLKKYPADILKLFYLHAHYSSPIDFSWSNMEDAKSAYERIDILRGKLAKMDIAPSAVSLKEIEALRERFIESMDDDFNTPKALACAFDLINFSNKAIEEDDTKILSQALHLFNEISQIFCFTFTKEIHIAISDEEIVEKIKLRAKLRKAKKFDQADQVRQDLEEKGVILEDAKGGTEWRRKL